MDHQQINGRDVFIVDAHHEVLAAWAHVRERLGFPPHLLSFDSHTDCHRAFMRHLRCPYDDPALVLKGNPLLQKVRFADPVSISDAITLLAHDEHIDCARRADISIGSDSSVQPVELSTLRDSWEAGPLYRDYPFG